MSQNKSKSKVPDWFKNTPPKVRARSPFGKMVLTQVNVDYVGPSISAKCYKEACVGSDELFGTISSFIEQCESPIEKQLAVAQKPPRFLQHSIDNGKSAIASTVISETSHISEITHKLVSETIRPCLMNKGWDHAAFEPPPALWETVIISPQQVIGNYRADLLVMLVDRVVTPDKKPIMAVIECDGRAYHAANEDQVARDKKRDREMQAMGYSVFRFTGTEIFKDADKCASDVVRFCISLRDGRGTKL